LKPERRSALVIERKHGGVYRLDAEERADIRETLPENGERRGRFGRGREGNL
jgi:hypothetical protein